MNKRAFYIVLAVTILFSCLCGCGSSDKSTITDTQKNYDDSELARATELGIGCYKEADEAVSYAEFIGMLDQVVLLSSQDNFSAWEPLLSAARNSPREMTRREGMLAVYMAAEALGPDFYQYNNTAKGMQIFDEIAAFDEWLFWDEMWGCDYSLFPDVEATPLNGEASYVNAGYFYSMNRASPLNGQSIFDYDSDAKSMRPADPFTHTEALRAAIRLYDSYSAVISRAITEEDMKILSDAAARREAILNSPTEISITGTKYYVSAAGNDNNDGRSPETAWASLEKVNSAKLSPGDGVFFRRGDTWRGNALIAQNAITYSAYGEGAKPCIYGSPENGAAPEKWSLLEGTDNIWVFYKDIMDCGDIVLDGSMDLADKAPIWWTGERYVKDEPWDSHEDLLAKPDFDPVLDLEDLNYFNDVDYSGLGSEHPIYVYSHAELEGKLYFRCDAGNPGEIYESIEFCCDPYNGSVVTLEFGQGSVLDNLAVMYGGHAIEANGGKAVRNCEVAYMGAMTHTFYEAETIYSGDGISHTLNMLVENNYVHHVFNGAIAAGEIAFAADDAHASTEDFQGNNTIRGNLIEYTAGITLINWEEDVNPLHMFKNVTIEDNYVMYCTSAGNPSGDKAKDIIAALVFTGKDIPLPCANENLVIRDNVFYCSKDALIISGMPEEYYPLYNGNTYAQYPNRAFAHWRFLDGSFGTVFSNEATDLDAFVKEYLGDANGIVLK